MNIFTIWVCDECDPSAAYLLHAWDEFSIDENREGWEEKVAEAKSRYEAHRIINISIPTSTVREAFLPTAVQGTATKQ